MPLADGYTLMEQVFLLPLLQYLAADSSQIQLFVLVKMLHSILLFFYIDLGTYTGVRTLGNGARIHRRTIYRTQSYEKICTFARVTVIFFKISHILAYFEC